MKRYLYFDTAYNTISNISKSLAIEDNHISFASITANTFAKFEIYENFYSKVNGSARLKNYESGFSVDSNKASHLYISDQISNHFLITGSVSNHNFTPSISEIKQNEIYLHKSLLSLSLKYSRPENSTACILQVGLQKNKAPVSVFSFSLGKINCTLKGVFTDRANLLYTSVLAHGIIASFKIDVSLSQLQGVECGYLYSKPNSNKTDNNSVYALYNLNKKSIEFGGYGLIGNKKLAASGRYELKSNDFSTEFGGLIFDIGELRLKFNSKQQLEFLTKISPKPWVDVSFKTTSTISSSVLKSVNFGWSLDFHKDF